MAGKGSEIVLLEEIIYTHAEKFGDQTDMVAVIEPCEQVDAFAAEGGMRQLVCQQTPPNRYLLSVERVALLQLLKDPDLNLARVAVLGYGSNDLDCYPLVGLCVDGLDNLAECPLSQ